MDTVETPQAPVSNLELAYNQCVNSSFYIVRHSYGRVLAYISLSLVADRESKATTIEETGLEEILAAVHVARLDVIPLQASDNVYMIMHPMEMDKCSLKTSVECPLLVPHPSPLLMKSMVALTARAYVVADSQLLQVLLFLGVKERSLRSVLVSSQDFSSYYPYLSIENEGHIKTIPDLYLHSESVELNEEMKIRRLMCSSHYYSFGEYDWDVLLDYNRSASLLYRLLAYPRTLTYDELKSLSMRHLTKCQALGLIRLQREDEKYIVEDCIMDAVEEIVALEGAKVARAAINWATTSVYGSWSSRNLVQYNNEISTESLISACSSKGSFKKSPEYVKMWIRSIASLLRQKSPCKDTDRVWEGCSLMHKDVKERIPRADSSSQ